MKAVRFVDPKGEVRVGSLDDSGSVIRDAGQSGQLGFVPTPEAWREIEAASGPEYNASEVRILAPLVPRQILAIGLNYRDHAEESQLDIPAVPVVFAKLPSSVTDPDAEIVIPREETRPDFEGEVAVIIGKTTYRADHDSAREAIGGITAFDDVSGRRAQLETPLRQFTLGKSFDTFTPFGPCVRSPEDVDLTNISVRTTVSGEVMQDSNTRNLIFSIAELVAYCSAGVTLQPGDIIATGTPGGVGDSRNPRRYLREGDVVEVWVDGVGTLRNPVVMEK